MNFVEKETRYTLVILTFQFWYSIKLICLITVKLKLEHGGWD